MKGMVHGVWPVSEKPGALVRMSIRLSICVSAVALWELAAYCGSPVGGLCAPVHEKRPRKQPPPPPPPPPPFPVVDGERSSSSGIYTGGVDRRGRHDKSDEREARDYTRRKEDSNNERTGVGIQGDDSTLPLSLSPFPSTPCIACLSIYERYDHQV